MLGRAVAFEIDGDDPDRGDAWSVVIKGRATEIERMQDVFDALDLPLFPWHASPKHRFVRIEPFDGAAAGSTSPSGPSPTTRYWVPPVAGRSEAPPICRTPARRDAGSACSGRCALATGTARSVTVEVERWNMLEFDAASKRFGDLAALDGCTFAARPARLTGFLGPNGAGKTTAMRAVFGLVELDAGTVRWRGGVIGSAERMRFGYMPEERGLYPRMRVRDQLVYLGELCGRTGSDVARSVDTWLERLGLADRRTTAWMRCRTATSNAFSWSRHWSTSRSCSCSTSRSPGSTRWRWP